MTSIDDATIRQAADALLRGELVVMPTETVYGLAAVATDPAAIAKIFAVKQRPPDNPLIVHVASLEAAEEVASEIREEARLLAGAFWPGPLTLVLPKRAGVPDEVTAGLPTVAVRVPAHPVARALLEAVQKPLAAPSANTFMSLSPTRAQDVQEEIVRQVAMVLDGGQAVVGIESTVLDCTESLRILRPGGVSRRQIERVLGRELSEIGAPTVRRAPGMYDRHYAPRTPVRLVDRLLSDQAGLTFGHPEEAQIHMPDNAIEYAAALYRSLADLDGLHLETIYIESPPRTPEWEAVWDRLKKAAS